jgi:cell division protein FtsW
MAIERALPARGMSTAPGMPRAASYHRAKAATPRRILAPRLLFIAVTAALVVFGLVMVYSASFVEGFTNPNIQDSSYIFRHQLMLVGVGLAALIVTLIIDYRVWNGFASVIPWAAVVLLLIFTLATGNEALGGKRWLDLFGFNLQPSEFAKIAILLVSGMLLVRLRASTNARPLVIMIAASVGIPALLIMLQPDLGTTLIALAGFIAVAYFGELSMKPLFIAVVLIALIAAAATLFTGFRMGRIDAWLDPWAYADNEGYQIVNSLYAFADGGVTGVGLGMSHQKYLYLPLPHNDLIFPIIGEEFGLIGAALVVVLFLLFLYAAFRIARNAPDLYGRVIAGAAATMIGFQAFLNMLCMVNLLPMTGKPLPFFSAGGSSIIVTLMLVGLIINVSLRSKISDGAVERRDQLLIIEGGRVNPRGGGQRGGQPLSKGRNSRQMSGGGIPQVGSSRGRALRNGGAQAKTAPAKAVRMTAARTGAARTGTAAPMPTKLPAKQQFRKPPAQTKTAVKAALRRPPARGAQSSRQQGASQQAARQQSAPQQVSRQQTARQQVVRQQVVRSSEHGPANPLFSLSPARNRGYDGRSASSSSGPRSARPRSRASSPFVDQKGPRR